MPPLIPWLLTSLAVAAPDPGPRCRDTTVWLRPDAAPHGTPAEARRLDTWLNQTPDPDTPLLSAAEIAALNARNAATLGAWRDPVAPPPDLDQTDAELRDRLRHIGERVRSGEYVPSPAPPVGDPFERIAQRVEFALPIDTLHALIEPADLRCLPSSTGLYRGRIDLDFDRNQCSRLHPGDLVRVTRASSDGWLYVRAGHVVGWLHRPALTPPIDPGDPLLTAPFVTVTDDLVPASTARGELVFLRLGARFPAFAPEGLLVPTLEGFEPAFVQETRHLHPDYPPLTRRRVLSLLFARLGDPYGWGGYRGFRDCSSLLLDVFATFGIRLGRNSSIQGLAGSEVVELANLSDEAKLSAIRRAHARGLVFLYMPGHIMLYLGALDGPPPTTQAAAAPLGAGVYAISAISEYLVPCPEGGHQTVRIDRVDVTDLARGAHTERQSFLARLTRLSVFGR
jgi:hypothetical protein